MDSSLKTLLGCFALASAVAIGAGMARQQPPAAAKKPDAPAAAKAEEEEGDDEETIKLTDAPVAVQSAIAKVTPTDKITKVTKETDEGVTLFEVEYTQDGAKCSAAFASSGDLLEIEKEVKEANVPAPAMAALKKKYPGATFAHIVSVQRFKFETVVTMNGKKHPVDFDAAGAIDDESDEGEENGGEKNEKNEKNGDDKTK